MKKRLVIKIGSSTLMAETDRISRGKIESIARQIMELREEYDVILVSSGAIATARQFIHFSNWNNQIESKQALSAIGQPLLIQIYNEVFRDFNLITAQCLLTYTNFEHEQSKQNTVNTLNELLKHGYIPIVNENDTVSVEEIIVGDNDKLSALVASLLKADLLMLVSDIDGIFDKNPHLHKDAKLIPEVSDLDSVKQYIEERDSKVGTGGMTTKIQAAEICLNNGIEMYIVNGRNEQFVLDAIKGKRPCTRFLPTR